METEEVKLDDRVFVVKQLMVEEALPVLQMEDLTGYEMSIEMCKIAVTEDGESLGEELMKLPMSYLTSLVVVNNKLNGAKGNV